MDGTANTELSRSKEPLDQVRLWFAEGATEAEVIESIAAHWPDADAAELVAGAFSKLGEIGRSDQDALCGWCMEATALCYRKMYEMGDYPGALRAIKQIRDLAEV